MAETTSKYVCRKCGRDAFKNRFSFTAHLRFCGVAKKSGTKAAVKTAPVASSDGVVGKLQAEAAALRRKADRLDEMAKELQAMS